MKMHYSHRLSASQKEKVVGLFIIIPIIILLIVFIFIGRTKHFFEEKYKIKAVFKEGEGLKAGIPIILSGIDIGAIKSVQLNEQNQVEAILEIRKVYQSKIRNDSKATVAKAGFIGEQRIKIFPGSPALPIIPDGGKINVEEAMVIDDIVNRVKPVLENIEKTLNKIAEIAGNIPSTAASDILGNIKSITEDIKKGKGSAGAILTERELYNNINETVKKADTAMQKINDILVKVDSTSGHLPEITQSIRKELPPILEDIRGTLKNVRESSVELPAVLDSTQKIMKKIEEISVRLPAIMENLEKTTKNIKEASEEMPAVASSARDSAEDANNIIKGAKKSWPISGFVQEEKETKIPTGERVQNE